MAICPNCNQPFSPPAYRGGGQATYCSSKCRKQARNKRYRMRHPDRPRQWSKTYYHKRKELKHANDRQEAVPG